MWDCLNLKTTVTREQTEFQGLSDFPIEHRDEILMENIIRQTEEMQRTAEVAVLASSIKKKKTKSLVQSQMLQEVSNLLGKILLVMCVF